MTRVSGRIGSSVPPHDGRCAVWSRHPNAPTPRKQGRDFQFLVFFWQSRAAATPQGHHVRVKSQMRLDFQSEGECIDVFVGSHRESRATPRR